MEQIPRADRLLVQAYSRNRGRWWWRSMPGLLIDAGCIAFGVYWVLLFFFWLGYDERGSSLWLTYRVVRVVLLLLMTAAFIVAVRRARRAR